MSDDWITGLLKETAEVFAYTAWLMAGILFALALGLGVGVGWLLWG